MPVDDGGVRVDTVAKLDAVAGVLPYRLSPAARGGLIFGYSNLTERQIDEGVRRLARATSSLRNGADTAPTPST